MGNDLTRTLERRLNAVMTKELGSLALLAHLLPGVEVRIYQGAHGDWHGSVLLDPALYPRDTLPERGNRPLTDSGTGRHWYDLSASLRDHRNQTSRSADEARADLDTKITLLLAAIASTRLVESLAPLVAELEHAEFVERPRRY